MVVLLHHYLSKFHALLLFCSGKFCVVVLDLASAVFFVWKSEQVEKLCLLKYQQTYSLCNSFHSQSENFVQDMNY